MGQKFYYIYKITNTLTGMIYVGKRITDTNYINDGYLGSSTILAYITNKHGRKILKKEVLELCTDEKHLSEREVYWIEFLQSTDSKIGYNLTKGGVGGPTNKGKVFSQEWKDNIAAARKKQGNTEKHKLAKLNPDYIKKQSESGIKAWETQNILEKRTITRDKLKEQGLLRTRKGIPNRKKNEEDCSSNIN